MITEDWCYVYFIVNGVSIAVVSDDYAADSDGILDQLTAMGKGYLDVKTRRNKPNLKK